MIPRKQINKYKKRTGGLFIILLCGIEPKAVKREFILDNIKRGYFTLSNPVKKCYRLKKSEMLLLTSSYNAIMTPKLGVSIPDFYKQYYQECLIQRPYAYAKIAM